MKIAVIGANGKQGSLIVKEAVDRELDVTAIVRSENKSTANKFIKKDLFDLDYSDLEEFDVVIDAFGTWAPESLSDHLKSIKHLSDILSGKNIRLLIVGGAGSLYTNPEHTEQLMDGEDFPDAFKPLASSMGESLKELRTRNDVNWTYISPAADFKADGERTGNYILAGEEFTVNDRGVNEISYADYAIAMVDEATEGKNIRKRISVLGK